MTHPCTECGRMTDSDPDYCWPGKCAGCSNKGIDKDARIAALEVQLREREAECNGVRDMLGLLSSVSPERVLEEMRDIGESLRHEKNRAEAAEKTVRELRSNYEREQRCHHKAADDAVNAEAALAAERTRRIAAEDRLADYGRSCRCDECAVRGYAECPRESSANALAAALEENKRLRERRFPIMEGPSIPWRMILSHENQAKRNHDQTFEELARRGGLSPAEALAVLDDLRWRDSRWRDREAHDELERRRAAFEDCSRADDCSDCMRTGKDSCRERGGDGCALRRADDAGRVERVRKELSRRLPGLFQGNDIARDRAADMARAVLAAADGRKP